MATVNRENIGVLTDKVVVKVSKEDYLPSFEKAIKNYSKQANIPGFRKGMVPAGMIKKMYGTSVFADEVIKSVEKGLTDYISAEQLEIFAQPLPLEENSQPQLDMNNPAEYSFAFEIGLKQDFKLADLASEPLTSYKVTVSDAMVDEAIESVRIKPAVKAEDTAGPTAETTANAAGEKEEQAPAADAPEDTSDQSREASAEEEKPAEKYELNEEFFKQIFPDKEITTEDDFRAEVRAQLQAQWDNQSKNQLMDQVYHTLLDHTQIEFPKDFLRRWMKSGMEKPKTDEEIEKEFPTFVNQLKWTLITDKVAKDNNIDVSPEEIADYARHQPFGYMRGMGGSFEDMMQQPWVTEYVNKMMQDRKFVEDSYHRIRTDKVFSWAESQVKPVEQAISREEFDKMQAEHHHHH